MLYRSIAAILLQGWAVLGMAAASRAAAPRASVDRPAAVGVRAGAGPVRRSSSVPRTTWSEVQAENSPEAYANFLYLCPDDPHVAEAFVRLVRVSEPGKTRVTDVVFLGASGPFQPDGFFALDAQRQRSTLRVTDALSHTPRGKALLPALQTLLDGPEASVRLAAAELLFALDELWWFPGPAAGQRAGLNEAVLDGLRAMLFQQGTPAPPAAAYWLWHVGRRRNVGPLGEMLAHANNPAQRRAAADVLGTLGGAEALDPLLAALAGDRDALVRATAAESLGDLFDVRAMVGLSAALQCDSQAEVRVAAAGSLRMFGTPQAAGPLGRALGCDKSPAVRYTAACGLGTLGDPAAVPGLIAALGDDDKAVRLAAAETLGVLGDRRAVAPLLGLLVDDKWEPLRRSVVESLAALGDPAALPALATLVHQEKSGEPTPSVLGAALAIRRFGDPRAVHRLLQLLCDNDSQGAALSLGFLDASPKALALLARGQRVHWYRREATWPGRRLFDPRTVHRLIDALTEDPAEMRRSAALALGMIGDPRGLEALARCLARDQDGRVREAAVRGLAVMEGPERIGPLLSALQDQSRRVVLRAAEALGEVRAPQLVEQLSAALVRRAFAAAVDDPLASQDALRAAIFAALAATGDSRAAAPLIAGLQDKSLPARESAALALGVLKDRKAVEPLVAALRDESSWVRQRAAQALGMLGDPRARNPLLALLDDQAPEVRDAAVSALALLGRGPDRPAILAALSTVASGIRYRMSYWTALFSLGWRPATVEQCVRLWAAQDQRLLMAAVWPASKACLLDDARHADPLALQRVGELLIALGKEEVLPDLVGLLKSRGNKPLAVLYYYSGNARLHQAAVAWAEEWGKGEFPANQPDGSVQWGGM
jgi:HEAT repeat protein